ncbi:MAG TPA: hypothetical protein VEK79_21735, partial [Thermoanaerobaculia bacterium]|nr:hypothetical protein [Thermoanaerobaculia bacterium]
SDIEKNDLRRECLGLDQRRRAVRDGPDVGAAPPQHDDQQVTCVRIVFDHQDAPCARWSFLGGRLFLGRDRSLGSREADREFASMVRPRARRRSDLRENDTSRRYCALVDNGNLQR